jgi:hypothetical protein
MSNLDVYRRRSLLTNVQLIDTIEVFARHINATGSGQINFNLRQYVRQSCLYAKPANGN